MNFAREEEITLAETHLAEVLEQTFETMTLRDNITLSQTIDSNVQPVTADGNLLQRVFLNLANNAHAMPDGGCLTVTAKRTNDMLEITFVDTGEGISEEDMDRIFDPLFTTKIKGTGLGLAVCQGIIERHGGTIDVRRNSEPTGGTTFEIRIPAKRINGENQ